MRLGDLTRGGKEKQAQPCVFAERGRAHGKRAEGWHWRRGRTSPTWDGATSTAPLDPTRAVLSRVLAFGLLPHAACVAGVARILALCPALMEPDL